MVQSTVAEILQLPAKFAANYYVILPDLTGAILWVFIILFIYLTYVYFYGSKTGFTLLVAPPEQSTIRSDTIEKATQPKRAKWQKSTALTSASDIYKKLYDVPSKFTTPLKPASSLAWQTTGTSAA